MVFPPENFYMAHFLVNGLIFCHKLMDEDVGTIPEIYDINPGHIVT